MIEKPVEVVWKLLWDGSAETFGEGTEKMLSNVKATNKVLTDGPNQTTSAFFLLTERGRCL